ncbi:MAG: TM2 domain-containing protein [Clostridia bacterium]|nr:TM2 domain-containing protein [Clostridia bacterium]
MMFGPRKRKTVALILCIIGFFGFAGLHRMYVGKVGSGVLHFLTYGFCAIGTIIDLISILSGGFRDSYGQPLV